MAVNDEIFKNLEVYRGGTINERVYNFLGSLGYTGTINDRLGQFEEGGRKGWQGLIRAWGQYTPAQLFSQKQEGVWYEPKPIVTGQQVLYQDSAGTTPVAADGDPVGLGLDRSRGLVLGPELVSNGTFDSDISGWTDSSSTTGYIEWNSSGYLDVVSIEGGGRGIATHVFPTVAGETYQFNWNNVNVASGYLMRVGKSIGDTEYVNTSSPSIGSTIFKATDTSAVITIYGPSTSTGGVATFDNISVRELPGNHLTQPTSADRPTYGTDGVIHWLGLDGAGDHLLVGESSFQGQPQLFVCCAIRPTQLPSGTSASGHGGDEAYVVHQAGDDNDIFGLTVSDAGVGFYCDVGLDASLIAGTVALNTTSVITAFWNGDDMVVRQDGIEIGRTALAGTGGDTTTNGIQMLGRNTGSSTTYLAGNVYGAILRFSVPTESDIEKVESYLAKQAGITL